MTGATPVFVDINAETCVMDIDDLQSRITERTKAIVPVHLYGQMVDMDAVMEIAREHGLRVVEDCAQSTGATYKGTTSGTNGDFGAFSFYPSKNLGAFGDGGAVSTSSRENYDRLVMLRNYGQSKRYYHDSVGINSRLDEIQAADSFGTAAVCAGVERTPARNRTTLYERLDQCRASSRGGGRQRARLSPICHPD